MRENRRKVTIREDATGIYFNAMGVTWRPDPWFKKDSAFCNEAREFRKSHGGIVEGSYTPDYPNTGDKIFAEPDPAKGSSMVEVPILINGDEGYSTNNWSDETLKDI